MRTLALYTTMYPAAQPFLADWYLSVQEQTDQDFELWIALDGMDVSTACEAMGAEPDAVWLRSRDGDTVAQVRQMAFSKMADRCDAMVLTDSDDVLHPRRVASARALLAESDLAGCGLRLVDERGLATGPVLGLPPGCSPDELLPRHNVFGLSNTAWRSTMLRRCLPIPAAAVLVDWFLATQAWLLEARLAFDDDIGMDYRQHGANMVRVVPPFSGEQVARETGHTRRHYDLVLASAPLDARPERLAGVVRAAAEVARFQREVVMEPERLDRYVAALNTVAAAPVWGRVVACREFRHMWTSRS